MTPIRYLAVRDIAEMLGVTTATASQYRLPEPDALVGKTRGWLPETIDTWRANRPGQGARTDLRK